MKMLLGLAEKLFPLIQCSVLVQLDFTRSCHNLNKVDAKTLDFRVDGFDDCVSPPG